MSIKKQQLLLQCKSFSEKVPSNKIETNSISRNQTSDMYIRSVTYSHLCHGRLKINKGAAAVWGKLFAHLVIFQTVSKCQKLDIYQVHICLSFKNSEK